MVQAILHIIALRVRGRRQALIILRQIHTNKKPMDSSTITPKENTTTKKTYQFCLRICRTGSSQVVKEGGEYQEHEQKQQAIQTRRRATPRPRPAPPAETVCGGENPQPADRRSQFHSQDSRRPAKLKTSDTTLVCRHRVLVATPWPRHGC